MERNLKDELEDRVNGKATPPPPPPPAFNHQHHHEQQQQCRLVHTAGLKLALSTHSTARVSRAHQALPPHAAKDLSTTSTFSAHPLPTQEQQQCGRLNTTPTLHFLTGLTSAAVTPPLHRLL
ncbi:hypothetical protein E2C01_059218 [Portunus trituberculatus]|uniref:Uncharacterized protein n=1 Tax=Portunus trituberculatus TaxID=210409 RepID=A0A5B7H1Y4_PORTR|nr:hypothetical protein [Portunus trituberculatus]